MSSSGNGISRRINHQVVIRVAWLGLGMVLMSGLQFLYLQKSPPDAEELNPRTHHRPGSQGNHGPWGDVRTKEITIERPDELIWKHFPTQPQWLFKNVTAAKLSEFLATAAQDPAEKQALLDTNLWKIEARGIVITPPSAFVLRLSPRARQEIYSALAEFPENINHYNAFRFPAAQKERWLANSGLSEETVEQVKRMWYRHGAAQCFSDLEWIETLPESQKHLLVKTLSRVPALLMYLRIDSTTSVDAMVAYWGASVKTLVESLSKVPGGASVDIAQFLPAFPRSHLNTFPDLPPNASAAYQDCFWTALNFFSPLPNERFSDPEYRIDFIRKNYHSIPTGLKYGDLVTLINAQGKGIHSAVYVADDVVFTKNGWTAAQPWILMKIVDLLAMYPEPARLVAFRANNT